MGSQAAISPPGSRLQPHPRDRRQPQNERVSALRRVTEPGPGCRTPRAARLGTLPSGQSPRAPRPVSLSLPQT